MAKWGGGRRAVPHLAMRSEAVAVQLFKFKLFKAGWLAGWPAGWLFKLFRLFKLFKLFKVFKAG